MRFDRDGKQQRYVEWEIAPGILKRAWVQYKTGDKDWVLIIGGSGIDEGVLFRRPPRAFRRVSHRAADGMQPVQE